MPKGWDAKDSKGKGKAGKAKNSSKGSEPSFQNAGRKGKGACSYDSSVQSGSGSGELPKDLEPLSRELVQLLRHKGLQQLRPDGFAPLKSVVAALRSKPSSDQVEAVTLLSKRDGHARFELLEEHGEKWIRAREKHSLRSVELSQPKAGAEVGISLSMSQKSQDPQGCDSPSADAVRVIGKALCSFDASKYEYDDQYISIEVGEDLFLHRDVPQEDGWAFGNTSRACGWFPANIWTPCEAQDETSTRRKEVANCNKVGETVHNFGSERLTVDALHAELVNARTEIKRLEGELSKERSVSAGLRATLSELHPAGNAQPSVNRFAKLRGSASSQAKTADRTNKQKLQTHLLDAFPNIKNEGIKYHITDCQKDAQGRSLWRASVEITEMGDPFPGEFCQCKDEAEQSAAFHALRQLGGLKES